MDIFVEFVGGGLVEDNCVLGLVLDWISMSVIAESGDMVNLEQEPELQPEPNGDILTFTLGPLLLGLGLSCYCGSHDD